MSEEAMVQFCCSLKLSQGDWFTVVRLQPEVVTGRLVHWSGCSLRLSQGDWFTVVRLQPEVVTGRLVHCGQVAA
ncbi:hypothetical protein ACOMHN_017360 [Nucella lapillus]